MLLRLANHAALNPHLIDKLIVIKGIPYNWIFKKVPQGDQLLPPWEADVDDNIPESIRNLCEPITYCKWFPDVRHYDQTYKGFWDERTVLGLKLDCSYGPAIEMWNRIEEYIEGTIPRTERMPIPALVAPDQKSPFAPHFARKRVGVGGLELVPTQIPVVDLTSYQVALVPETPKTVASAPAVVFETKPDSFECQTCDFKTDKERALRMHMTKKHFAKEKVTA